MGEGGMNRDEAVRIAIDCMHWVWNRRQPDYVPGSDEDTTVRNISDDALEQAATLLGQEEGDGTQD